MRKWDLNDDLLFPRVAVVAYVKNLVALSETPVEIVRVVGRFPSSYWLQGLTPEGKSVDLYAPFVVDDRFRMYIPFVLQRTFGSRAEPAWSTDGRRNRNCFVVARQGSSDMWLVPNWHCFEDYARSGRAASFDEIKTYPAKVEAFLERAKSLGLGDAFKFVDPNGDEVIVPFRPLVINRRRNSESLDERQNGSKAQSGPQPLLAGPR